MGRVYTGMLRARRYNDGERPGGWARSVEEDAETSIQYSHKVTCSNLFFNFNFFFFWFNHYSPTSRARYFSLFPIPFCLGSDLSSAATKGVYTRDDGSDFFSSAACIRHFMGF